MKCCVASIFSRSTRSPDAICGKAAAFLVVLVVAAFLVERQEAVEADDACRSREAIASPSGLRAVMSIVVRSSSAEAIWLAIVRFQISS